MLRDMWWLWLTWLVLVTVLWLSSSWANRQHRHLHNAYRAERGEPPLWPDLYCDCCNPNRTGEATDGR